MSANKHKPHIIVLPEDDRDRQIARGFELHDQVDDRRYEIMPSAGGWRVVLQKFQSEYIQYMRKTPECVVVLLIDFDGYYDDRRIEFDLAIPEDLKHRVFVLGARTIPEHVTQSLGKSYEEVGLGLAEDCFNEVEGDWASDELKHNAPDRNRLAPIAKKILFSK